MIQRSFPGSRSKAADSRIWAELDALVYERTK